MTLDDYSYGWEHRARATELQDIAAMDRLAAQLAPPSALRRYAATRRSRGAEATTRWTELRRRFSSHHPHLVGK